MNESLLKVVYILAPSHSGSTLLAMLLGSHRRAVTVGELKISNLDDPEVYLCSCGVRIADCSFWIQVAKKMAQRGLHFEVTEAGMDFQQVGSWYADQLLKPLVGGASREKIRNAMLSLSPAWRKLFPRIAKRNIALMESVCEIAGANMIVDSSKIGVRLKILQKIPELDIRVIRLIRDGRGVALSYMDPARFADARDPGLRGGGTGDDRSDECLSISEATYEWLRSNQEAEHILSGMDRSRWTQVRYEDLCRRPKETMQELFEFLQLDPKDALRNYRAAEHHVIGNGMRLDATSEITLDERWKTIMTPEKLKAFEVVAGKQNRRYGYD